MSFRLRSFDVSPPGGYLFPGQQSGPMIEVVARNLSAYRKGNGISRSSYKECLHDVSCHNCQRLNNSPRWCVEDTSGENIIALNDNAPGIAPCATCGAPVT